MAFNVIKIKFTEKKYFLRRFNFKFTEKFIFLLRKYIKFTDFFFTVTNLRFTGKFLKFTETF